MEELLMDCGCKFRVVGPPLYEGGPPALDFNPLNRDDINWDCPKTWELFASGRTQGVFQLEKRLGQVWSKKLKPESLDHIAALTALLRPGCLKAKDENGVSMTQHYVLRKNGEEEAVPFDESIADILRESYQINVFQEESILIVRKVAGFNLVEADMLRSAIGKKDAAKMSQVRKMFLEKAKEIGLLTEEKAIQLFDYIEKSARFSFNKAHAASYGDTSYITAYLKSHFTPVFYLKWLEHAQDKADRFEEINNLVEDAKLFDIVVNPPDITSVEPSFHIVDNSTIQFGFLNAKGIGEKAMDKLTQFAKSIDKSWGLGRFIIEAVASISQKHLKILAEVGALRNLFKESRSEIIRQIELYDILTKTEQTKLLKVVREKNMVGDFRTIMKETAKKGEGGICHSETRVGVLSSLFSSSNSLEDTLQYIVEKERELLGIPLSMHYADEVPPERVDSSCLEWVKGRKREAVIGVEIEDVIFQTIKTGKNAGKQMATLTVSDGTAKMTCKAFSEATGQYEYLFRPENLLILSGNRLQDDSFSIRKAWNAQ